MKNILIASAALALPLTALSAPSGLEDVAKVTKRDDGLYNVECTYGGTEEGVTVEALKAGKVCQLGEKRQAVRFQKFETTGSCAVSSLDHKMGITESTVAISGLSITPKQMFANCKMNLFYAIPAGYQIGLKKTAISVSLNEYEGDPVGFVFAAGEEENGQIQDVEVSKQGAGSYELEFEDYVFTGCSTGLSAPQKIAFDIFLAPGQGAMTAGSAAFTGFTYKDTAIRACE